MKNYVQEGDYLTITAASTISSGDGVMVGDLFGVAVTDIANGSTGVLATKGIYDIEKATDVGSGGTIWNPAYWDATQGKVTAIATGNTQIGLFAETVLDAATAAQILLTPVTGEKDVVTVSYRHAGAGSKATEAFFIAPAPMQVVSIREVHSAAEATAGSLTADLTKDTGTDAPGAGSVLLGNTKINLKGTANTVQAPALTGTAANLLLAAGDRISFKPSAAGTEIANVVVTVYLRLL